MRPGRVICACVLLGCFACPADPPVRAPYNFAVETTDDFDVVNVVWGRFDRNCDEYQLELSVDGGEWRTLASEKLDCTIVGGTLQFNPCMDEPLHGDDDTLPRARAPAGRFPAGAVDHPSDFTERDELLGPGPRRSSLVPI